jgi:hypothetical protein
MTIQSTTVQNVEKETVEKGIVEKGIVEVNQEISMLTLGFVKKLTLPPTFIHLRLEPRRRCCAHARVKQGAA